jgi:hypothetical protein
MPDRLLRRLSLILWALLLLVPALASAVQVCPNSTNRKDQHRFIF